MARSHRILAVWTGVALTRRFVPGMEASRFFLVSPPKEALPRPFKFSANLRALPGERFRILTELCLVDSLWTTALAAPPAPITSKFLSTGSHPYDLIARNAPSPSVL